VVAPADADRPDDVRLQVGYPLMMDWMAEIAAEPPTHHAGYRPDEPFGFRLISRRTFEVYNSNGQEDAYLAREHRYNPAYMNPEDLSTLGLAAGDLVEISRRRATILGVVKSGPTCPSA
jgi:anaerobic selenocysteine-containing dehydrogenase